MVEMVKVVHHKASFQPFDYRALTGTVNYFRLNLILAISERDLLCNAVCQAKQSPAWCDLIVL